MGGRVRVRVSAMDLINYQTTLNFIGLARIDPWARDVNELSQLGSARVGVSTQF